MKTLAKKLIALGALSLVIGCVSQLVQGTQVAQEAFTAAGKILTPTNPEYGSVLSKIGSDFGSLGGFINDFDKSVDAGKPSIAIEVQNAANTAEADMSGFLALAQVKNPDKIAIANTAVAIGASVVDIIVQHIAPSAPVVAQSAVIGGTPLPRLKDLPGAPSAKTAKDLKDIWNKTVSGSYPKAKI